MSAGTDLASFLEDLEGEVGAASLAVCSPVCMLQPHLHANTSCRASQPESHTCLLSLHLCL